MRGRTSALISLSAVSQQAFNTSKGSPNLRRHNFYSDCSIISTSTPAGYRRIIPTKQSSSRPVLQGSCTPHINGFTETPNRCDGLHCQSFVHVPCETREGTNTKALNCKLMSLILSARSSSSSSFAFLSGLRFFCQVMSHGSYLRISQIRVC